MRTRAPYDHRFQNARLGEGLLRYRYSRYPVFGILGIRQGGIENVFSGIRKAFRKMPIPRLQPCDRTHLRHKICRERMKDSGISVPHLFATAFRGGVKENRLHSIWKRFFRGDCPGMNRIMVARCRMKANQTFRFGKGFQNTG